MLLLKNLEQFSLSVLVVFCQMVNVMMVVHLTTMTGLLNQKMVTTVLMVISLFGMKLWILLLNYHQWVFVLTRKLSNVKLKSLVTKIVCNQNGIKLFLMVSSHLLSVVVSVNLVWQCSCSVRNISEKFKSSVWPKEVRDTYENIL